MKNLFLLFIWMPLSISAQDATSTEQKAIDACIAMGTPKSMCLAMNSKKTITDDAWKDLVKNLGVKFCDLTHEEFILFSILYIEQLRSGLVSSQPPIILPELPRLQDVGSNLPLSSQKININWNLFQTKYKKSGSQIDLGSIKKAYRNQFNDDTPSYKGGVIISDINNPSKKLLIPHPTIQENFWVFLQTVSDYVESALVP